MSLDNILLIPGLGGRVVVEPPSGFDADPLFTVYRSGASFSTSYDPLEKIPATTNTYYVDVETGSDSNPGTEAEPFKSIYQAVHNRSQNILVYVKPGVYRGQDSWRGAIAGTNGGNFNVVVRRWGESGRIVSTLDLGTLSWSLHSGDVWQATVSGVSGVRVVDSISLDTHGNGVVLRNQTSVANVQANPGSSHYASNTVYVRTSDSREPDGDIVVYSNGNNGVFRGATLWIEYSDFLGGSVPFYCRNFAATEQKSYLSHCRFLYGSLTTGGAVVEDGVEAIFFQCEASNNELDGFKYLSAGTYRVNYAEINCEAYNNGIQTVTNVANGSSSHDGCKGVRINGVYSGSRGRSLHDITGNKSWLVACSSGPSSDLASVGQRAAFACGTGVGDTSQMWLESCVSLSTETDCEAATDAEIFIRNLTRTANNDIGTVTSF